MRETRARLNEETDKATTVLISYIYDFPKG